MDFTLALSNKRRTYFVVVEMANEKAKEGESIRGVVFGYAGLATPVSPESGSLQSSDSVKASKYHRTGIKGTSTKLRYAASVVCSSSVWSSEFFF